MTDQPPRRRRMHRRPRRSTAIFSRGPVTITIGHSSPRKLRARLNSGGSGVISQPKSREKRRPLLPAEGAAQYPGLLKGATGRRYLPGSSKSPGERAADTEKGAGYPKARPRSRDSRAVSPVYLTRAPPLYRPFFRGSSNKIPPMCIVGGGAASFAYDL